MSRPPPDPKPAGPKGSAGTRMPQPKGSDHADQPRFRGWPARHRPKMAEPSLVHARRRPSCLSRRSPAGSSSSSRPGGRPCRRSVYCDRSLSHRITRYRPSVGLMDCRSPQMRIRALDSRSGGDAADLSAWCLPISFSATDCPDVPLTLAGLVPRICCGLNRVRVRV